MQVVADLHLHSRFSRAVSPQMNLPTMARVAKQKGLDLLSASDFTHPVWFKEISSQLEESSEGVYSLKSEYQSPKFETNSNSQNKEIQKQIQFLLSTEIACISKHKDKLRRIHNLIFAPNLETVEKINAALVKRGVNLSADGRPIMGLTSKNVLELIMEIDERCFLIPCHVWTPHFGMYGSASGYDTLVEAFDELTPYIYGIETGLSSDPDMNWSMPELRNRSILSFSDAHSAPKMGREATIFEMAELTFMNLKKAIMRESQLSGFSSQLSAAGQSVISSSVEKTEKQITGQQEAENRQPKTDNRILYTLEFYPEEGKYHFSGHRVCKVAYGPDEIREKGTVCPVCRKKMTEGVVVRVQQLADERLSKRVTIKKNEADLQWFTDAMQEQPPYVKLVPLLEIVAESMYSTVASQKVQTMFATLVDKVGSELDILLKVPVREIEKVGGERLAEGVQKVREGNIAIDPGYDGEYGHVKIWKEGEESQEKQKAQLSLEF